MTVKYIVIVIRKGFPNSANLLNIYMAVVITMSRISFGGLQPKWLQKRIVRLFIVNRGNWSRNPVNIKEANKQAKIYVGWSLALHLFYFMHIDSPRMR